MEKMKNEEQNYVYVLGINQGKSANECSLILTRQDKDKKTVILEELGEKAIIWLDFFYKLHSDKAKVVVEKDK